MPSEFVLPAGGSQNLEVSIDLSRVKGRPISRTEQSFESALTLVTRNGSKRFSLSGAIRRPYVLTEDPIRLERPIVYGMASPPLRFSLWTDPAVAALSVKASAADGEVQLVEELEDGRITFDLVANSNRMLGPIQFPITIEGTAIDDRKIGPYRHQVIGRVEADTQWEPQSLLLFAGLTTRSAVDEIRLTSRTGAPILSVDVESLPDFVELEIKDGHAENPAKSVRIVEVRPAGGKEGVAVASGQIVLRIRSAADSGTTFVPIPVTVQTVK